MTSKCKHTQEVNRLLLEWHGLRSKRKIHQDEIAKINRDIVTVRRQIDLAMEKIPVDPWTPDDLPL